MSDNEQQLLSETWLRRAQRLNPYYQQRLGWSVPNVRRNYLANPITKPLAYAAIARLRRTVPRMVAKAIRAGEVDAVMSHFSLVTPHFVRTVQRAGGEFRGSESFETPSSSRALGR